MLLARAGLLHELHLDTKLDKIEQAMSLPLRFAGEALPFIGKDLNSNALSSSLRADLGGTQPLAGSNKVPMAVNQNIQDQLLLLNQAREKKGRKPVQMDKIQTNF